MFVIIKRQNIYRIIYEAFLIIEFNISSPEYLLEFIFWFSICHNEHHYQELLRMWDTRMKEGTNFNRYTVILENWVGGGCK